MNRKRLVCRNCGAGQICGLFEIADLLRSRGMLRREAEPDAATVLMLLEGSIDQLRCPQCDAEGLAVDESFAADRDDWDEWAIDAAAPVVRVCEGCGQKIPPERLELFPTAKRCATCESSQKDEEHVEYCPRCGNIMTYRASGSGVTRYQFYCSACRR